MVPVSRVSAARNRFSCREGVVGAATRATTPRFRQALAPTQPVTHDDFRLGEVESPGLAFAELPRSSWRDHEWSYNRRYRSNFFGWPSERLTLPRLRGRAVPFPYGPP